MAQKPSIPKGTRDFSPAEMVRRNYIFDTVKGVFQRYGYLPIETPAMENLSTLMGKYGEEGDKLLFKILNSGDYLSDFDESQREIIEDLVRMKREFLSKVINNKNRSEVLSILRNRSDDSQSKNIIDDIVLQHLMLEEIILKDADGGFSLGQNVREQDLKKEIQRILDTTFKEFLKKKFIDYVGKEKGLRYDLTVPFARFVVQYQNDITFPFKRYQIQPVWRADRPQKGRYREFFQCDVDVVGSNSLLNEVELMQIVDEVYRRLNINVLLKLNNRKILAGIAETIGQPERIIDITVAIDKLDKIGLDKVNQELAEKGLPQEAIDRLQPIIQLTGTNAEKLSVIRSVIGSSAIGVKGIEEVETILSTVAAIGLSLDVELDLTLARGLNYYTGAIFEVKAKDVAIGSITGGGRYDDLTGIFGLKNVSGVGISFGADRIYDVMTQLNLFPENHAATTKVLFVNFGEKEALYALGLLAQVRQAGINAELYPDNSDKMKKQMGYADKKQIPFVAIIGDEEMNQQKIMLKSMQSGQQQLVDLAQLIEIVGA